MSLPGRWLVRGRGAAEWDEYTAYGMRHVALCIFWPASFCFTNEMPEYEMHSEYEIYTHTNARVCVCVCMCSEYL